VSTNLLGGYNLRNRALAAGWNGSQALIATVTINSGVYVIGTLFETAWSTGNPALPAGSTIQLTNNGVIGGSGGQGGNGGTAHDATLTDGGTGGQGGTGFYANYAINVYNNGTIAGGGGGGGGGGAAYLDLSFKSIVQFQDASGGGGGGGRANGVAGANGSVSATGGAAYGPDSPPTNGTLLAPGSGSSSGNVGSYGPDNGVGGAGGQFGQPGNPGGLAGGEYTARSNPGSGGPAGQAIFGGAYIYWYAYGTRIGAIDNPGTNMVSGGATAGFNGAQVVASRLTNTSATTTARAIFNADGTCTGTTTPTSSSSNSLTGTSWYTPTSPGIGNSYWIRATSTSGNPPNGGGALNTWLPLSSGQTFTMSVTSIYSIRAGNVLFEISSSSSGSPLVSSGTVYLEASNDF
jgi:hypothetical protein